MYLRIDYLSGLLITGNGDFDCDLNGCFVHLCPPLRKDQECQGWEEERKEGWMCIDEGEGVRQKKERNDTLYLASSP